MLFQLVERLPETQFRVIHLRFVEQKEHPGDCPGARTALTEIASALRDLPSEDFKNRLKTELQRRAAMTTSTSTVAGIGAGFRTITPFLIHARRPSWSTS